MDSLRIFARVDDPSPELYEYLAKKEHVVDPLQCWVDMATARDFEWTDEIREKTAEFGLADEEGEILGTFETLAEAEHAKGRAKVRFELVLDEDEAPKRPKGAKAPAEAPVTEMLSNAGVA